MHELSIARNITKIVHQEYEKRKFTTPIKKIFFSAGKMNAIIPISLQLNFNIVKKNYEEMKNADLIIEEKIVIIHCLQCGETVDINEPIFLCRNCGSKNIKLVQGKEMHVESFEI